MKRIFLVVSVLSLTSLSVWAQDYTPFYLEDAYWIVYEIIPGMGASGGSRTWGYHTKSDTIINNKIYKQLATKNICAINTTINGSFVDTNYVYNEEVIIGGLREEDKKVYFLRFDEELPFRLLQFVVSRFEPNQDHLLYDFDLIVGDTTFFSTLTYVNNNTNTTFEREFHTFTVGEVAPRDGFRTFEVQPNTRFIRQESGYQSEGIGSSYGLFGNYDSSLKNLSFSPIDGISITYEEGSLRCNQIVNNTIDIEEPEIQIIPNPATDIILIQNITLDLIHNIDVFAANGSLVMRLNNNHLTELSLSIEHLPNGIYYLQLRQTNGQMLSKHFIKL